MGNPNPIKKFKKGEIANPAGRPKKGETITDIAKQFLDNIPPGQKKTNKEMFFEKVYSMALAGDISALKLIWNYTDGMPIQKGEVKLEDVTFRGLTNPQLLDIIKEDD
jgi:hypothetical protein